MGQHQGFCCYQYELTSKNVCIMFSLTLGLLSAIICTVIASYHSNSVGVTQYRHVMANIYTLLHELVCNTVSCVTLRGRIKDDAREVYLR